VVTVRRAIVQDAPALGRLHVRAWQAAYRGQMPAAADRKGSRVGRYAVFSQTDTCFVLTLVKGSRVQSLQRSRKVIPVSRAMRSSSDGHT
jgi:hypothetical protein